MAAEAKAKKGKKGQGPSFFQEGLNGTEAAIRGGKFLLRGGSYVGANALGSASYMDKYPKFKKWGMPGIMAFVGLAGEMFLSKDNTAARLVSGITEGAGVWSIQALTASALGPEKAAKIGLAGLGAPGATTDVPRDQSGIDWMAYADALDNAAEQQPGAAQSMAGIQQPKRNNILY